MRIVSVVSAKGGVGKTTICANLCTALCLHGQSVLGVDLDPQNALRFHLGLSPDEPRGSARAVLAGEPLHTACVGGRQGVVVLPYGDVDEDQRLRFEDLLEQEPHWLSSAMAELGLPRDAWVLVDTPPGPSVYIQQALTAAHVALVTTLADAASYATLPIMDRLIATYSASRPDFLGAAYVINQVNRARQLAKDVTQVMQAHLGEQVIGLVHQDQAVSEALASNQSVLEYDQHSQSTRDFSQLARWLIEHVQTH